MKAFVFPGQGSQFVGMGKDLYDNNPLAKELFDKADEILGFKITEIMFAGTDEQLKETKVTQPAVFLHSVISALCLGDEFKPDMVAGHSLGEFSALVAAGALSFEDGLKLVAARAMLCRRLVSRIRVLWQQSSVWLMRRLRKSVHLFQRMVRFALLLTLTALVSWLSLVQQRVSMRLAS